MKRILLLNFTLGILHSALAQVPDWLWARTAGTSANEYATAVTVDGSGNIYVTGFFDGTSVTFGTTTLNNAGPVTTPDVFLVKYDSTGNVLWAKSGGGNYFDKGYAVTTDVNGNVFVAGYFYSSNATFGTATLSNPQSGCDYFVVKYNSAGTVQWARSAGGNDNEIPGGITADGNGNVYVTGSFVSPSFMVGSTLLSNNLYPYNDIFIARYDSLGNVVWAKRAGGAGSDGASAVAADAFGNIFVAGSFSSNSITFGSTTLVENGGSNAFLTKYDTSGAVLWAKTTGGFSADVATGVATDASGDVYITGYFDGSPLTFSTISLTDSGQSDLFVAKYNAAGTALWAQSAGGSNMDEGKSIATGPGGNVYVTGHFFSQSITFGNYTLTNDGNNDIFITRYDAAGNVLGGRRAGGSAIESGQGVAADANANVYVTGTFNSSSITFGATSLSNAGANDMFLGRIDSAIVGLGEIKPENVWSIFPNPVMNEFRIQNSEFRIERVEVLDVLGRKHIDLISGVDEKSIHVNVSSLASGIYFVRIKSAESDGFARFIKQ